MLRRSSTFALLAFVVLAVATAACGGGTTKAALRSTALTTTSSTAAPTTSTTTLESKIFADLDAYNDMYRRALESPDPSNRQLNDHMTGPTIAQFRTFLLQLQQQHKSFRGPSTDRYRLVSVDGTNAVVDECSTEQGHWYRDGQQLPDEPGESGLIGSELKVLLEGGTWKVFNGTSKPSACPG